MSISPHLGVAWNCNIDVFQGAVSIGESDNWDVNV